MTTPIHSTCPFGTDGRHRRRLVLNMGCTGLPERAVGPGVARYFQQRKGDTRLPLPRTTPKLPTIPKIPGATTIIRRLLPWPAQALLTGLDYRWVEAPPHVTVPPNWGVVCTAAPHPDYPALAGYVRSSIAYRPLNPNPAVVACTDNLAQCGLGAQAVSPGAMNPLNSTKRWLVFHGPNASNRYYLYQELSVTGLTTCANNTALKPRMLRMPTRIPTTLPPPVVWPDILPHILPPTLPRIDPPVPKPFKAIPRMPSIEEFPDVYVPGEGPSRGPNRFSPLPSPRPDVVEIPWPGPDFFPPPGTHPVPLPGPGPAPVTSPKPAPLPPGTVPLPSGNPVPMPAPSPAPIQFRWPGVSMRMDPPGTSRTRLRPPGAREKEKKFVLAVDPRSVLGRGINIVTEGMDLINCLHDGMPKHLQAKRLRGKDGKTVKPSFKRRAAALYRGMSQSDEDWLTADTFTECLKNQIEDFVFGKVGQKIAQASRRNGKMQGYQIGGSARRRVTGIN